MPDQKRARILRSAIELLYFGYRNFTEGPDRILEKRGLNRAHHRILYFVGQNPGLSVNALLAILNVSKQALNPPLRQLIEMRLINSNKAAHDGRLRLLSLSEKGSKLERRLSETQIRQLADVFAEAGFTIRTQLQVDESQVLFRLTLDDCKTTKEQEILVLSFLNHGNLSYMPGRY